MNERANRWNIRLASPEDIPHLRALEDEAGMRFSGLELIDEALDPNFPLDEMARLIDLRQVWIGCVNGERAGFVIASVREMGAYLDELHVLTAYGRRGFGGRLLAHACEWARSYGHASITLSTFRDVPWNAPFYRKHGFRDLQATEWTPGMRAILWREAEHGLRIDARLFMRRDLSLSRP
jgi:GNAT superfamily N-acetyltransferase